MGRGRSGSGVCSSKDRFTVARQGEESGSKSIGCREERMGEKGIWILNI